MGWFLRMLLLPLWVVVFLRVKAAQEATLLRTLAAGVERQLPIVAFLEAMADGALPPDAAAIPAEGTVRVSRLAKAPRGLNEPVCCRNSSFSANGWPDRPRSPASIRITGVRRI